MRSLPRRSPLSGPWLSVAFENANVPTMISDEERKYLFWLGSEVWTGEGHIVEMGPWLGGSTVCLAAGMRANPRLGPAERRLHVFDNFIWRSFMAERASLPLMEGQSFQPYFERNLEPFADLVCVHRQSLPDEAVAGDPHAGAIRDLTPDADRVLRWGRGEPVEILFIDGAKSWSGMAHLLSEIAPDLIPGRSLIVCQDYKYWGAYWVIAILELLIDHLELEHVLRSNSVSFKVGAPISAADIAGLPCLRDLEAGPALGALGSAAARLRAAEDPDGAAVVELAKVRMLGHLGRMGEAYALFRSVERRWPAVLPGNLERARRWLQEQTGEHVCPGRAYRLKTSLRRARRRYIPRLAMRARAN